MKRITSASCSIAPDSRKSDMIGRLFGRCSNPRFNCESAITGTSSSLARLLSERDISEISVARFSPGTRAGHELQIIHDDQAQLAALPRQATRARAQFHRVQ